ncbi:cell wall anchor protein [Rhizobium vallis]|uniref:Cell wall anchor protein n=1 Tax=Rhizobium vallis TaxID=634290 RepID=A0A3S0R990_9HYPH|nr:alginate lyase family protein [Rhizobium vallis]RUM24594.1 cell wall anchor protein [Rhizobium vallis]
MPLVNVIVAALSKNLPDADTEATASTKNGDGKGSAGTTQPNSESAGGTTTPEQGSGTPTSPGNGSATSGDASSGGNSNADTVTPGGGKTFVHPGLLQTQSDFDRIIAQLKAKSEPTVSGWQRLINNSHSSLKYSPRPVLLVVRGKNPSNPENYALLFNDAAAAYALALRWKIGGDDAYADRAIKVLNAWSSTLTAVDGSSDKFLASGIYGYELANAAEIMRTYKGWSADDFSKFQNMMLTIFYRMNHDFLVNHNGAKIDHYWANWDLCNIASMLAIGVLTDRKDIYKEAIDYLYNGAGNGAFHKMFWKVYDGGLAQGQEAGRDQGHAMLDIALIGAICQMAWSQGDDLFGYDNNLVLAGAEYVAKYNLGYDVPYTTYKNSDTTQTVISDGSRGPNLRPMWEMFYNHYVVLKGLDAPYISTFTTLARPEGGGGDYGPNSGGFDQLGYGTLLYTLH